MNRQTSPDAYGVVTEPATSTLQRLLPGPGRAAARMRARGQPWTRQPLSAP